MAGIREALSGLWLASDDSRMIEEGATWRTWGEVRRLVETIDAELSRVGCGEGARIGIVMENRTESVASLIAVLSRGRTVITLNPMQPPARVAADAVASRPHVVLASGAVWDDEDFASVLARTASLGFAVDGTDVLARTSGRVEFDPVEGDEQDPVAVEMFTSGTTGPPKRIPLTWRQLDSAMAAVHSHTGRDGAASTLFTGRVALVAFSIAHIGGLWGVIQALVEARPLVILPRFTVEAWADTIAEHGLAVAGLPPAAIRSVLDAGVPREKLASLRAVMAGTTFVSPDLADEFTDRYGIPVMTMYGATEFSGAVAGWSKSLHSEWWQRKRGSVGRPLPGVRMRTVDEAGEVLPVGASGRLEVCSRQTGSGSAEWVRTSDLAHVDEDGFLYIDGRADDTIVRGGFKIQPETVCNALRAHASVLDASVFGRTDERLGQVPVAVVELVADAEPVPEEELRRFVRGQLTAYEVPVAIHTVPALPRGAALKVDRRRLLEMVAEFEPLPASS